MGTPMMLAVGVLAFLVFILFGVVIELYRDVRQLRDVAGILDRPLNVDLGDVAGTTPGSHGLPSQLDSAAAAVVLFLSEQCGTCRALAAGLRGRLPEGLWVVLEARNAPSATEFIQAYDLALLQADERVSVDVAGEIARRIGLDTTPVGFHVERGRLVRATTIPSRRYLHSVLPNPISLRRTDSMPKERYAG